MKKFHQRKFDNKALSDTPAPLRPPAYASDGWRAPFAMYRSPRKYATMDTMNRNAASKPSHEPMPNRTP